MSGLIPKNKTEFTNQPSEDKLYEIYREAAEARIQSEDNAKSVYVNRVLIMLFGATSLFFSTCGRSCGHAAEPKPSVMYLMPVPQEDESQQAEGEGQEENIHESAPRTGEEPQMLENYMLDKPVRDTLTLKL